ncbi:MAG: asparagine synthase (glutamine-hydrolyzing) [Firmicutes bacterium]|nr:asparagine synthase (glutamine-hydrolyzing) [Bacillota bacterium]
MCGFVGFYGQLSDKEHIVSDMAALIEHRGPDSGGSFVEGDVALGFRRLSIIDLEGGTQPMHSVDERYVITFNGEIYNYRELKKDLIEKFGSRFSTDSDTEVIIETYRHYGTETASMLRGMFAFVIYDREQGTLYGARDYFGIKPFYYSFQEGSFLFGSEIKSFLAFPGFKKEVNPEALKMYLVFQYSPLDETMFKGVYKLKPGTWFTYSKDEGLKTFKYFDPMFDRKSRSFEEAVNIIDETVLSSVEYHQIADVEVGSFLSGGVDSSYIASTVKPMRTYTVGFEVKGFDETELAAELAKRLGMNHRKKEISADEFFEVLPKVQYHSDEPHANLSSVPLYFLAGLAAEDLKVVLSGEGADELFGGYDWYIQSNESIRYKKLPLGLRKFLAATLGNIPQAHIKRFFKSNAQEVEDSYIGQAYIMDDSEANSLLQPAYKCAITHKDVTAPYYAKVKGEDDLTKKMYLDMNLWLPGDILLKADKMTMAHSLELRVPYLDREVWNVARTLSSQQQMEGRATKRALRAAAFRHIPEEWANRKKAGFLVPFREWIKDEKYGSMVRETFHRDYVSQFFDPGKLDAMLDGYLAGGKREEARKIYTIYSFLIWYDEYFVKR